MADEVEIAIGDGIPVEQLDIPKEHVDTLQGMRARMSKLCRFTDSSSTGQGKKIHRFPRGLRGMGGADDRYIAPTVVAIGPFHHGQLHLQDMEEVKLEAVHLFCSGTGCSIELIYAKVLSVVSQARGCYGDEYTVMRMADPNFTAMMLADGCFLLQLMAVRESLFSAYSTEYSILKDIMLLENQIPWLVLEALMELLPKDAPPVDVRGFVANVGDKFFPKQEDEGWWSRLRLIGEMKRRPRATAGGAIPADGGGKRIPRDRLWSWPSRLRLGGEIEPRRSGDTCSYEDYTPAHLLDLLLYRQIGRMPKDEDWDDDDDDEEESTANSSLRPSSAVQLAQIGVKLTASEAAWFGDMRVIKRTVSGELSLSPVFLNDVSACWLVNMVALEASVGGGGESVVSLYLSVLAMLMDSEEDVQQLRAKHVLYSTLSNAQALAFFKRVGQHVGFGHRYFVVLELIELYKKHRPVRVFLSRQLYNSYKTMTIASLVSIIAVLVGIFKTLLSKKQQ